MRYVMCGTACVHCPLILFFGVNVGVMHTSVSVSWLDVRVFPAISDS